MDTNNVMVGDTWESCDSRRKGTRFEVVEIAGFVVTVKRPNGSKGTLKLGRIKETKSGYRLVSRAGAAVAA